MWGEESSPGREDSLSEPRGSIGSLLNSGKCWYEERSDRHQGWGPPWRALCAVIKNLGLSRGQWGPGKHAKQAQDQLRSLQSEMPGGTVAPHLGGSCSVDEEPTKALLDVRGKCFAFSLLKNKRSCKDHMQGQWLKHWGLRGIMWWPREPVCRARSRKSRGLAHVSSTPSWVPARLRAHS